jgi:hypothetical protein
MNHCLAYLLTHIQVQGRSITYYNINHHFHNQHIAQYLGYDDYFIIVHFEDDYDDLYGIQNSLGTMIAFKEVKALISVLFKNNIPYEL